MTSLSRRHFLQLSASVTATSFLAACAPSAPSGGSDSGGDGGGGGAAASSTIEVWGYPRTENDLETIFDPMNASFAEVHPDITVEVEVQPWGGRREKLYAAAAAGTSPDLWDATTDTVPAFIEKGVILGLNDFLTDEQLGSYTEAELAAASLNGELYMPLFEGEVNGFAYNGAMLSELGYDPETAEFATWDSLYGLAEKAAENGYYLENLSTFNWGEFLATVHEAGGQVYADDRTHSNFTEQPVIDALTRWVTEYENGWVPLEYAIGSTDEQGGLPDYWLSLEQATARKEDAACVQDVEANPDLQYVIGHPRSMDGSQTPVSGLVSGQGWAITQQSENTDAALTWMKFMITPEQVGARANLAGTTPVGTQSKEYWTPDECVFEHASRFGDLLFAGVDANTLWQESKVVAGPHFQAAVLGEATVEESLESIKTEIDALLQEKYG